VAYLDTSAYVKLPLCEVEKGALLRELVEWEGFVSSSLLGVESLRTCARYGSHYERAAREWMDGLSLLPIDDGVLDVAAELEPAGLRSLDALHLATAISLGDEVGAFFTYDDRLGRAADENGLTVARPV
jgi:predicted nucleic acid-binding protein